MEAKSRDPRARAPSLEILIPFRFASEPQAANQINAMQIGVKNNEIDILVRYRKWEEHCGFPRSCWLVGLPFSTILAAVRFRLYQGKASE